MIEGYSFKALQIYHDNERKVKKERVVDIFLAKETIKKIGPYPDDDQRTLLVVLEGLQPATLEVHEPYADVLKRITT